MKKFEPTCYRYKTEAELEADELDESFRAQQEDRKPKKVRVTKDIPCTVETYYMNATPENPKKGRRMVKVRFYKGREYHIPARDWSLILQALEFDVRDVRGK